MLRNCYGKIMSKYDDPSVYKKSAYEVVVSGNYTYIRFSTDDVGAIHRIDKSVSGTTKICWAWGSWTDKDTLTYTSDLNSLINVTEA